MPRRHYPTLFAKMAFLPCKIGIISSRNRHFWLAKQGFLENDDISTIE